MERTITIEEETIYQEDYQMRMLQENRIEGLLSTKGRGADAKSCYDYDVSGKVSMKALFDRNEIKDKDIKKFLKRLLNVISETERYLLDKHKILLSPEYIYCENDEYYFCYYPPGKGNLWEAFHMLTEYFVKRADYADKACVQTVFLLHKETMEENYSLKKIVENCLEEEQTEEKEACKGTETSDYYDNTEHDWITSQEMGSAIMEETENMWTPVKRFLKRCKKPKWGDWDGLYIEEEELG